MEGSLNSSSDNDSPQDEGLRFTPTQDWFSFNINTWRLLFPRVTSPTPRVLEIGSWEGRSAVFLLTELCAKGGDIVCVDHFDLMRTSAGRERYAKITHNLTLTRKPFRILDQFSFPALMTLLEEEMSAADPGFDWIYIDGSHEADDTFLDGELAWRLAKKGAIVIFDDYRWDKEPDDSIHHPKRGIDAFMTLHTGEYEVLSSSTQYQVVIQKSSDMRIGYLVTERVEQRLDDALGYGIHLALTVDSAYAAATAVAIRSAVVHTSGRMTIYVVDCGLTIKDREGIRVSAPQTPNVTIMFIDLPNRAFAAGGNSTWAKIDMISLLPVERVLYLDADVLVRGDLKRLWDVNLGGNALGAVVDLGFPMGHSDIQRAEYFNAGVLLMDLTKIRANIADLKELAGVMKESRFRDQDVLNIHFRGDWLPLELKWNAQGLGTYAELPSADRDTLDLSDLQCPSIVHFTGPVHPGIKHILNPYLQPYTAKPWGYAGAPGHPFQGEWWQVVEQTAWKGWRSTKFFRETCIGAKEKATQDALEQFEDIVKRETPME
ncbi:glycosyltransferase family 8 protein [Sparassis crispa]|uniref:Glycosyltransferase family 8 protein n=1 Tax=Sparassis crispa TaxID=139825 RepID=A0A401GAB4_9APHY|nr:glycosyltransferase family 8 protein [Sparassis crispa]GBE79089.1 glycosyltransferase family 8 protein [Sparassis crispa]